MTTTKREEMDVYVWKFMYLPATPARLQEIVPCSVGPRFREDAAKTIRTLYCQLLDEHNQVQELRSQLDAALLHVRLLTREVLQPAAGEQDGANTNERPVGYF
jgi:hypothetical protein